MNSANELKIEDKKTGFSKLLAEIPIQVKYAFIFAFIFGYIINLYAFTNIIPNSDGLSRVYDTQQMTVSGRWFLHYVSMLNGYIEAPALIGFLSVLFISVSSALTVDLLRIESKICAVLVGILMVSIPSLAYTYLYMFTASAYMFAVMLAVVAVWVTGKYRLGFIPGILVLALSIGTYQTYISVAAALALCFIMKEAICGNDALKKALKQLLMIVAGFVVYWIILKIFLAVKDLQLLSYKNIDSAGSGMTIGSLIQSVITCYRDAYYYFTKPGEVISYLTKTIVVLNWCTGLVSLFLIVKVAKIKELHRRPADIAVFIIALVLFPLGVNCMLLFSSQAPIMRYAFVYFYILVIFLVSIVVKECEHGNNAYKAFRLVSKAQICILVVMVLFFAQIDNLAYIESETAQRSSERFATTLVSRVEGTEGYYEGMEVVVVGTFPSDIYYSDIEAFNLVKHYSSPSSSIFIENKHIYYYLNDWLNVQWTEPAEDTFEEVTATTEFQEMPLYPDSGSVKIIDDKIVVKLSSTYTPKQQYEIDYENRR